MEKINLDFTNCKNALDMHNELREKFDFPDYYGENLSALWDCLDNYCNWELYVIIRGVDKIPKNIFNYMDKIFEIFKEVHEKTPNITFVVES